jgi:uncharacterized protein
MQPKELKVKCPHCGRGFNYPDSAFRPFCSEKCRLIDLGSWLNETYAIPTKEKLEEESNEEDNDSE